MGDTDQRPLTLGEATEPADAKPTADVMAWQDEQTRRAIKEADAGDFASAEEMKSTVRKFVPNG